MTIVPLAQLPQTDVEALLDRAFGIDRRGRTAYRLREGVDQIESLSFAALDAAGAMVGTIQCWPVRFVADAALPDVPMILVGPVAVEPGVQRGGIGRQLTQHMLTAAGDSEAAGADALMLIGDPDYYTRFFDFSAEATGEWRLPGPFERHRLLARGPAVPCGAGRVEARR